MLTARQLETLDRRVKLLTERVHRFAWTEFKTRRGTTGAVNESGKKVYDGRAQAVLHPNYKPRGAKGERKAQPDIEPQRQKDREDEGRNATGGKKASPKQLGHLRYGRMKNPREVAKRIEEATAMRGGKPPLAGPRKEGSFAPEPVRRAPHPVTQIAPDSASPEAEDAKRKKQLGNLDYGRRKNPREVGKRIDEATEMRGGKAPLSGPRKPGQFTPEPRRRPMAGKTTLAPHGAAPDVQDAHLRYGRAKNAASRQTPKVAGQTQLEPQRRQAAPDPQPRGPAKTTQLDPRTNRPPGPKTTLAHEKRVYGGKRAKTQYAPGKPTFDSKGVPATGSPSPFPSRASRDAAAEEKRQKVEAGEKKEGDRYRNVRERQARAGDPKAVGWDSSEHTRNASPKVEEDPDFGFEWDAPGAQSQLEQLEDGAIPQRNLDTLANRTNKTVADEDEGIFSLPKPKGGTSGPDYFGSTGKGVKQKLPPSHFKERRANQKARKDDASMWSDQSTTATKAHAILTCLGR